VIEYQEDPFKAERQWLNRDQISYFIVMEYRWAYKIAVSYLPAPVAKKLRARAKAKKKRQRAKAKGI
jgi:hypothetical protein